VLAPILRAIGMSLTEIIARDLIKAMGKEQRARFVERVLDEFFSSMSPADRKEMMHRYLPRIIEELMQGMTQSDRRKMVEELLPIIKGGTGAEKESDQEKKSGA